MLCNKTIDKIFHLTLHQKLWQKWRFFTNYLLVIDHYIGFRENAIFGENSQKIIHGIVSQMNISTLG
jgi:hypothetical protein